MVDLLIKLDSRGGLPCPVARNMLPEATPLERLIEEGKLLGGEKTAGK